MEIIKALVTRLRNTGVLLVVGILLIAYIAFGFLYFQQGMRQREYATQINQLNAVLTRQLSGSKQLEDRYQEINRALTPITNTEAIQLIVDIARNSGVDVDEASGKLNIPKASRSEQKVGSSTYTVISLRGIRVQASQASIDVFLADLDTGETLETMVLKGANTSQTIFNYTGKEAARRAEFTAVIAAVNSMMSDNGLSVIPDPLSFDDGTAVNITGDDPSTVGIIEGFPDTTTTPFEKGYSGNSTPRYGYVLYEHDKIDTVNPTQFTTETYFNTLKTKYYYTCEADGTVRQFGSADVTVAIEYSESGQSTPETIVIVDINIYTKAE